jgi:phosphoglycerate dehydrogenase-like enzyme
MTLKHSVLFLTDRGLWHQEAALESAPVQLAVTMLRLPPRVELLRLLPEAEFLITERVGVVDAEMIAAGSQLRLIQRLGSLTYDIDLEAARSAGVPVSAWPVYSCIMVAEHLIMQMLALAKRLPEAAAIASQAGDWVQPSRRTDEDAFAYNWSGREGLGPIFARVVGILGMGEIGVELATRLRGFSPSRVLYHKRSRLPEEVEAALGLAYASIDELFAESDFLCNLLPYSRHTDMLIGSGLISTMKPGAALVSCGSGSVIDEDALAQALSSGRLSGAALDTFEWEPIAADNPLLPLACDPAMNVLLTPHTAAGSYEEVPADRSREQDYENIVRILHGEPVLYRVA